MGSQSFQPETAPVPDIDVTVPHSARVWNYWLGGKDNYAVDRAIGDQVREAYPEIVENARAIRAFLARAVEYLAGEVGIRQFLDVGTGLPTADNTHEVAQRVAPSSRIVYVDNDPLVLTHARALLTSTPEGMTHYVDADLYEPDRIIAAAREALDFTQPVALMLLGILGHVADVNEARSIVRRLLDPLPSGSYLVLSDGTDAVTGEAVRRSHDDYNQSGAVPYHIRTAEEVAGFLEGLELVEPGFVAVTRWRPYQPPGAALPAETDGFGGVGRKP